MILHEFLTRKIKTAHQNSDPPGHMPPNSQEVFRKHQTCAQHRMVIYELSAQRADQEHKSSRQLNPFFFSLLSLPGGLLSTGVSFCLQQGGFLQSVKQSARWQVAQRPKTSTHWNNLPADSPLKVQIPPVSGRIHPLASHPESRNPHPLEQSTRLQAARRPNPSSDWENYPAGTGILEA